jgi:starch-binding outer membrane protein, SusD/RagB family
MVGFDENGDCWGGYGGPSVDLQAAFGCSAIDNPATRDNSDIRRHATMMLPGDVYDYFWTDKTYADNKKGFDYLRFIYDSDNYGKGGPGGTLQCNTGSNNVKNLFGDNQDHIDALGITPQSMANQLPTHLLRLSDVYLIYAEAVVNTNNAAAKDYVNKVRERAGAKPLDTVTWNDIWKERRLELAGEGDRWYDFVRRSYYDVDGCIAELKAQKRSYWNGLNDVYKKYIGENFDYSGDWDVSEVTYATDNDNPNVTASSFTLPFPTEDVVFNANMASSAPAIEVDVRATYQYDF